VDFSELVKGLLLILCHGVTLWLQGFYNLLPLLKLSCVGESFVKFFVVTMFVPS